VSRLFWCGFFTLWPIVAIVACAISPAMNWAFPDNEPAATELGRRIDDLFYLILIIVTIAFIGTMAALSWALWQASKEDKPKAWFTHGSHNLEMVWTIVPSGILLFIALYQVDVWAMYRMRSSVDEDAYLNNVVAEVTARQFEWRIRYPAPGTRFKDAADIHDWLSQPRAGDLYTVNHLHVPVNKQIVIWLKSGDVQHAFFVPKLRVKQDALPGQAIDIWFNVNKAGDYDLLCAELCGWGHYKMRGRLSAVSETDYQQALQDLKNYQEDDGVDDQPVARTTSP